MTTPPSRTSVVEQTAACGLPDLVRPQFFPGQRLTDRDLTAVVEWARARFRLDHLRGSWGVVCGLGVTAHAAAPGRPPAATVAPGFAVDAGGTPLVVREPLTAALTRVTGKTLGGPNPVKLTVGPYEIDVNSNWAVFDLVLCPEESVAESAAVGCGPDDRTCKTTRTSEGAVLKWERREWNDILGPQSSKAKDSPAVAFLKRFNAELPNAFAISRGGFQAGDVKKWVIGNATDIPEVGRTVPDFAGWLKEHGDRELSTHWGVARVLFWMADAVRRSPTPNHCPHPGESCVPLARVWTEIDGGYYAPRYVDDAPPVRRRYDSADGAGLKPAEYLGWQSRDALTALARLGLTATAERFETPADAEHLLNMMDDEAELTPPGKVVVRVSDAVSSSVPAVANASGDRVVGFRPATSKLVPVLTTPARLGVQLYKAGSGAKNTHGFSAAPAAEDHLISTALPTGGWVKVAIDPSKLPFPDGKKITDYTFWYHDDAQGVLTQLNIPLLGQSIVSTFQLPSTPRPAVNVTVVVDDKNGNLVAVSGAIEGDEQTPLESASFSPGNSKLSLVVTPFGSPGPLPGQTVVLLQSKLRHTLPLNVSLVNLWLTGVGGKLHASTEPPTDPASGLVGNIRQEKDLIESTVVSIETPPTTTKVWFWVTDGEDDFNQPFALPPMTVGKVDGVQKSAFNSVSSVMTVKILEKKIDVSVVSNFTEDKKAVLTLLNSEPNVLTLSNVTATQLVGKAGEQTFAIPTPNIGIAENKFQSFDLVATDKTSLWRVVVTFKGDANEDVSAGIDVTPTKAGQ